MSKQPSPGYVVTVRSPMPADLQERVTAALAQAVQQKRRNEHPSHDEGLLLHQAPKSSDPGSETTEAANASNPPVERNQDAS